MTAAPHRPKLACRARLRVDRRSGGTFLLYPERGLRLNDSAAAILRLCDGNRSCEDIAGMLSQSMGARSEDVLDFLRLMAGRGLLEGSP